MGSANPAVIVIESYQRYISPYKGFCCAHRVLTGEDSCSEFAKQVITARGFFGSIKAIWRRLEECKRSASFLNEAKTKKEPESEKGSNTGKKCAIADALACAPLSCGEVSFGSLAGAASGGCDGCACTPF